MTAVIGCLLIVAIAAIGVWSVCDDFKGKGL